MREILNINTAPQMESPRGATIGVKAVEPAYPYECLEKPLKLKKDEFVTGLREVRGGNWRPLTGDWSRIKNYVGRYQVVYPEVGGQSGFTEKFTNYYVTPTGSVVIGSQIRSGAGNAIYFSGSYLNNPNLSKSRGTGATLLLDDSGMPVLRFLEISTKKQLSLYPLEPQK